MESLIEAMRLAADEWARVNEENSMLRRVNEELREASAELREANAEIMEENKHLQAENARLESLGIRNANGVGIGAADYLDISRLNERQLQRLDAQLVNAKNTLLSVRTFDTRENQWKSVVNTTRGILNELSVRIREGRRSEGDGDPNCLVYIDQNRSESERVVGCVAWLNARARHHRQGKAEFDGGMFLETLYSLLEHRRLL